MTWEAFHHRGDVLQTVIAEAGTRRDGVLPIDLPGVRQVFRDELDLLATLQLRWHTRLAGRIERELAGQPLDLEAAVVTAWRAVADELPGVRLVLDRHREQPLDEDMARAMRIATAKERQMLALMSGQVSTMTVDAHGERLGARIEERARHTRVAAVPAPRTPARSTFADRLKAALVA